MFAWRSLSFSSICPIVYEDDGWGVDDTVGVFVGVWLIDGVLVGDGD